MNNVNQLHEALARVVLADREPSEVLTEITGIARAGDAPRRGSLYHVDPGRQGVYGCL